MKTLNDVVKSDDKNNLVCKNEKINCFIHFISIFHYVILYMIKEETLKNNDLQQDIIQLHYNTYTAKKSTW